MSWDGVKWMWCQHTTAVALSVSMFWGGVKSSKRWGFENTNLPCFIEHEFPAVHYKLSSHPNLRKINQYLAEICPNIRSSRFWVQDQYHLGSQCILNSWSVLNFYWSLILPRLIACKCSAIMQGRKHFGTFQDYNCQTLYISIRYIYQIRRGSLRGSHGQW